MYSVSKHLDAKLVFSLIHLNVYVRACPPQVAEQKTLGNSWLRLLIRAHLEVYS